MLLVATAFPALAQKQLVLLHHETVLKRYYAGDDIALKLKGSNEVIKSYVNNLSDTAVILHADVVPFRKIERVYFVQHKFYNTLGTLGVLAGVGYFVIDQLNRVVVNKDKPGLTASVSRFSIATIGIGLPLMLFKKRSQRIDYANQFLVVKKGSVFYKPDPNSYTTPYMPY